MDNMRAEKATSINLISLKSPAMRAFHVTWFTFFICFFGWFGIAPLMPVIREDLHLTKNQIGNIIIASVAITVFARLFFGWLCDRIGPRISYTLLLTFGALPLMLIGTSQNYETFLLFRLAIGMIGASFVITQFHTSIMFAPNVVGTANAMAAGWGNMGGGATLIIMPLVFGAFTALGVSNHDAWRYSMVIPGIAMLAMAIVYYFFTQDTPSGNFRRSTSTDSPNSTSLLTILRDYRVWMLFLAYGACFGIEITIDNIATLYFVDNFGLGLKEAGLIAGLFGVMNIFARALGGFVGDKCGNKFGLKGRVIALSLFLLFEGVGIMTFAQMETLPWAIASMLLFALFLKMSNGATYSVVPFVNTKAIGVVSAVVGAGGNVGAVLAGILFKSETLSYRDALMIISVAVIVVSVLSFLLTVPKVQSNTLPTDFQPASDLKESIALTPHLQKNYSPKSET